MRKDPSAAAEVLLADGWCSQEGVRGEVAPSAYMWTRLTQRCARGLEFRDLDTLFKVYVTHGPGNP